MTKEAAIEIGKREMITGGKCQIKIYDSDPREVQIAKVALAMTGVYKEYEKEIKRGKFNYSRGWQFDKQKAIDAWEQAENILNENKPVKFSGETWAQDMKDLKCHLVETWYSFIFLSFVIV